MTKVTNPLPIYLDGRGALLDGGYIYVGQPNLNPEIAGNRLQLYWDGGLTLPAAQPLRTLGGVVVRGQNPAVVFLAEANYSMTTRDSDNVLVDNIPSAIEAGGVAPQYQPLDPDLTAIAAIITTPYGRNLLALANQTALKSATGIPDALPLVGGTVTGNILRSGAGAYVYWSGAGFTGGRIFLTPSTASDPTSLPGDIWYAY